MSKIPRAEWGVISARHARGETIAKIAQGYGCTAPAIHYILKRHRQRAEHDKAAMHRDPAPPIHSAPQPQPPPAAGDASAAPRHEIRRQPAAVNGTAPGHDPEPAADHHAEPRTDRNGSAPSAFPQTDAARRRPALAAALDSRLHEEAEATIGEFRASFDVALAEDCTAARERLRQAASELMRMAARTTIVLDRLGAAREAAAGGRDHPRSAWAGRRFGG